MWYESYYCFSCVLLFLQCPPRFYHICIVSAGELNSSNNMTPITLSKVLDKVANKVEMFVRTTDNQFGFKKIHSTDMCVYALKEIVAKYGIKNCNLFMSFINASARGVPKYILKILVFRCAHKTVGVKWDNAVSAPYYGSPGDREIYQQCCKLYVQANMLLNVLAIVYLV